MNGRDPISRASHKAYVVDCSQSKQFSINEQKLMEHREISWSAGRLDYWLFISGAFIHFIEIKWHT